MIYILKLVMSFLLLVQEELNKHLNPIKVIYEPLNLMTQKRLDYSIEMMISSSLLYICSPKRSRLLRDNKNIILSRYSTIKKRTLSTYMNPLIEQQDHNFLMQIKNKFKLRVQKDIKVFLLVDEIHLKYYWDYKDGNIIGVSNNSNEASTRIFCFYS